MALLAHPLVQGLMHIVIEDGSHIRSVGVVTGGTVSLLDRVIDVLDLEGFFLRVVTLKAECRGLFLQQARIICRSMRRMACHAIISDRSVRHFSLTDFLTKLTMAVETKLTSRLDQIIRVI